MQNNTAHGLSSLDRRRVQPTLDTRTQEIISLSPTNVDLRAVFDTVRERSFLMRSRMTHAVGKHLLTLPLIGTNKKPSNFRHVTAR